MTLAELINKLTNLPLSPNTELFLEDGHYGLWELSGVELNPFFDSDEDANDNHAAGYTIKFV